MASTDRGRLPAWLKRRIPASPQAGEVRRVLEQLDLATVCHGAQCPNRAECFSRGTATFMILGDSCTRACRFCAVKSGAPSLPRADEPAAVAQACQTLSLHHVVITSVTRDDLPDGGASHFADTIRAVRTACPEAVIEVLTPDFQGQAEAVETVIAAGCDIFNHNVETVPRLYALARPEAQYIRSLRVLAEARRLMDAAGRGFTKSGLMVGLGESHDELMAVMDDLRGVRCDILTVGQYLQPSAAQLPVARYVTPEEFTAYQQDAAERGFAAVAAGPWVRSSYQADTIMPDPS
jgi:lipoic acid synthetase